MVANLIYKNQKFYNLTVVELSVEPPLYAYAKGFIYYNTLTGKFGINTGKRWDYSVQIIDNNGLVQGPQGPQGEPGPPAEMPFVELSQTSSTSEWTGTAYIPGFTSLYDGLTIRCFLPYNSTNTPVTLSLAVDTGNNIISPTTLPVYWLYPERLTTQVVQYAVFTLTYRQSVDGAGDGMWLCEYDKVGTGDVTGNNLTDNNLILGNGGKSIKASSYQVQPQGATASSWIGTDGYIPTEALISAFFQPLDADLTAIANLAGTSGFLIKTAADTWELDTNTYVTSAGMQIYLAANYVSQSLLTTTLSDYVLATDLADTLDSYALKSSLARVATSGLYSDLSGKPSTFPPSAHTHPWSQITGKPNNISGYNITDAYIYNGIIRLGNNTITPLTQHQSLANYVTTTQLDTRLAGYDPMYGTASGTRSHAIGSGATASGQYALALASNSTASANYAVALGSGAIASAASAFALGNSSVASATYAVSLGNNSVASGQYSLATGRNSYAMSTYAVVTATAMTGNIATETLSSAISNSRTYTTTVASDLSVGMVVLDNADVKTPLAVITGINRTTNVITLSNNVTVASGVTLAYRRGNAYNTASVAEGFQTASIGGYGSHAEGRYTTAQGQASHAEGWGTWATVAYQHAVGKWNATGNYAEVVGNGTSETQRSNIRTLDWNGNEWVAGNITAGGYIDATAIKIGGTIINVANAWMQGTASASNVIWVETSGTDYILHIGTTSITVSATGTATSIAWSGITGVPLTLTSLGNLSGTSNYGFLKLSSANTITVDTTSYALASHTHTISEITDFPSLAAVATSGSYTDLDNKPDIPTVYDGVLTLQLNNGTQTNSVTFSANSATDQTFSVDLSSYLTSHQTIYALNLSAGAYDSGSTTYSPATAALSISIPTSSDHITEGNTNLFFTNARAVDALSTTLSAYMLAANFTEANVYALFSNVRKYALDSGITSVKVSGYDSHLANTTVHITAGERTVWNSAYTATQNATSANIANRIVKRDANGDFAARQITATLIGNADTATTAAKLGTETKGGIKQPIYLDAGSPTAITETVGSATQPMYLHNGVMTATTYSLNKTVPADAVFSYSAGTGLKLTSTTFAVDYGAIASGNNKPVSGGTIFTKLADYALISTLKNVAFSGSYNDLDNKPDINDGTLTLKVNDEIVTTFSANSSQNKTFNVVTGGGGGLTSVGLIAPAGFTVSGSPLTSNGNITLGIDNNHFLPTNTQGDEWTTAYNEILAATYEGTGGTIIRRDQNGNFTASTITADLVGNASSATTATYLGNQTVGSGVKFIYLDRGEAKASASSLGGATQPIYLDNGQFRLCSSFAPVSHTHDWRYDITNKPDNLAGYGIGDAYTKTQADARYAPKSHTHTISNITDFPTLATVATSGLYSDLDGIPQTFAPSAHTHTVSDISNFPTLADVATSGLYSDLDGIPETFAPSAHTHYWSDILPETRPTTLAGYGLQNDAYITPEQDGYVTIRLGENSVVIDTSGTVSSVDWVAINNKPPIIAGPNGLASLSGTTTYGILKLTDTNKIEVDTTNYANQNAFSNVLVGTTTISANSTTDTLILLAGSNVTLTPSTTTKSVTISAIDTTYDDATQTVHGLMSTADKTKLDGIAANANNFVLTEATSSALGGVKIGYSTNQSQRKYAVQLDSSFKMFVNVPWTEYSLPTAGSNTLGGVMTGFETDSLNQNYGVRVDNSGNMYVNVPWSGGTYTLPVADDDTLGGVKTGYTPTLDKYYAVKADANGNMYVNVPWTDTTYGTATQSGAGLMSAADKTKLDGIEAEANNYSLPTASASTLGGVKTGYINNDKNYKVELDNNNRMFVNVDWQNTVYTLPEATDTALGGVKIGYESQDNQDYPVELDINNKMFVSVPWTDTHYSLPLATGETRGGVRVGYTNNNPSERKYAVQLDNEKMYVNVPWTDTTYQVATASTLGLVKIGYITNDKNYKVELNPSGQMFVSVPWTDTNTEYTAGTGLKLTGTEFAIDFGTITSGGTKAVTGGAIYSQLQIKPDYATFTPGDLVYAFNGNTLLTSGFSAKDSRTTWDANNDYYLPTMKGISAYVTGLGYTSNTGTVTSLTFQAGSGINVFPTTEITTSATVTITNTGVLSVSESRTNGTIRINTGGVGSEVPVHGLGGAAYMAEDYYAEASHTHDWRGDDITNKPITLAGYGITDAYTKGQADNKFALISHYQNWRTITNTPTSLREYGISDAYDKTYIDNNIYTKSQTYSSVEIDTNIYTKAEVNALISNLGVMTFMGTVATVNALPANASIGDMYVVEADGTPYVWDGTQWVALTLIDLSNYVTQSDIADVVRSTFAISAGSIVIGHNDTKRVVSSGKTILSSYSDLTDFTGTSAGDFVPTAAVIHSYASATYQPIGSYVTQSYLNDALDSYVSLTYLQQQNYVTLTYLQQNYATLAALDDYVLTTTLTSTLLGYVTTNALSDALQDMVTISANLLSGNIVTATGSQTVTNSGVRILKSTSLWNSVDSCVPTTALTDKRYPVNGGMDTGYLVIVSNKTQTTATVTGNTYQPHRYSTGASMSNWIGSDGYIPTESMIDHHIADNLIGNTLQGYSVELTRLAEVDKTNRTGYMYWNGLSYELADVQGGGSGNVTAESELYNGYIIVGDEDTYGVRASETQIVTSGGWNDTSEHVATIGNTYSYLQSYYQPLNTYLTGISTLPSVSAGGYLYYNGSSWSFSTPSGTGNVTAASTLTSGKLVRGVGDYGIATTNYEVATYSEIATTWDDNSNVYVPTMASIANRLSSLANIRFQAGQYNGGNSNYYYPNGSNKVINIPTNTSHLTDGGNIVMRSELSNYLPLAGGTMTGTINSCSIYPKTDKQYYLGHLLNYRYNNVASYGMCIQIKENINEICGISLDDNGYVYILGAQEGKEYIHVPEIRVKGNIASYDIGGSPWSLGTASHPFAALYLKSSTTNSNKVFRITVDDSSAITASEVTP